MGLKEKELIEILKTSGDVRKLIRGICGLPINEQRNVDDTSGTFSSAQSQSSFIDKRRIQDLQGHLHQANEQLSQLKAELQKYKNLTAENEQQIGSLTLTLQSIQKENRTLKETVSQVESEKETLDSQLTFANEVIEKMRRQFESAVKYWKTYRSLSVSVREGLSNVICDESVILFIASGTTADNLKAVWNYTRDILSDSFHQNDAESLKKIFEYFFTIYNASLPERVYERDSVEVGDELDEDIHDRSSGSCTSGKITSVLLKGYQCINTGKIICRSLVKV